jgi:hypothetical protein
LRAPLARCGSEHGGRGRDAFRTDIQPYELELMLLEDLQDPTTAPEPHEVVIREPEAA